VIVSSTGGVYGSGYYGGLLGDEDFAGSWPVRSFANIRLDDLAGTVGLSAAPSEGTAVNAVLSGWNAGAVFSYQWQRDGDAIPGATSDSYTPVAADVGHDLSVTVAATAENFGPGGGASPAFDVDDAGTAPV